MEHRQLWSGRRMGFKYPIKIGTVKQIAKVVKIYHLRRWWLRVEFPVCPHCSQLCAHRARKREANPTGV